MLNINEIQQTLVQKKNEIEEQLKRINVHRKRENGALDDDWKEQAVERQNDEVLDLLDDSVRVELNQINRALNKIEEGTYGICVKCSKPISENRIKAIIYTNVCINCATKIEN